MSFKRTISIKSTASTSTITTLRSNDLQNNTSNDLYEDRDHFQAIFTNDSRFFDTSLHLFKSYSALGYIQSNNDKTAITGSSTTHMHKHRWRPRLLSTNHHEHQHTGGLKAFLTPTLLRKSGPGTSNRSDSGISTNEPMNSSGKSPMIVHYKQTSIPNIQITSTDEESEVTITRL